MGKIDIKGLTGLSSSALKDLRGMYNNDDYIKYIETHQDEIETRNLLRPGFTPMQTADNMYVTKLIKDKIGDKAYREERINTYGLQDKVDYYNSLFPEDTTEVTVPQPVEKDVDYDPIKHENDINNAVVNTPIDMFDPLKNIFDDDYPRKEDGSQYSMLDIFEIRARKQNEINKTEQPEEWETPLIPFRKEKEVSPVDKGTESDTKKFADYTNKYLSAMQNDRNLSLSLYREFNDLMTKNSRFFKNYNYFNMPATEDFIMSEVAKYNAAKDMYGDEEAMKIALDDFQNLASENQPILFGHNSKFANTAGNFINNAVGYTAAWAGNILYSLNGVIKAFDPKSEIDDLSWWKEFNLYTADNPITKWGNNLQTTGYWLPSKQEEAKEVGFNPYENVRKAGHEFDFLDINTPFDMAPQIAYNLVSMYTGSGMAAVIQGASKTFGLRALSSSLATAQKMSKIRSFGIKAINKADDLLTMGLISYPLATAENSMNAFEAYDRVMSDGEKEMMDDAYKLFNEELNDPTSDAYKYVYENNPLPGPVEREMMSEEEAKKRNKEWQEKSNKLLNEYFTKKYGWIPGSKNATKEIETSAKIAAANTMAQSSAYTAFADMVFTDLLGGGARAIKKRLSRRLFPNVNPKIRFETGSDGFLSAVVNNPKYNSTMATLKGVTKGVVESVSEGGEEIFQNTNVSLNVGLELDYLKRYLEAAANEESTEDLARGFFENLDVAQKLLNENLFTEENLYSFLLAATSTAIGTPTLAKGSIMMAKTSRADRANMSGVDKFNAFLRNPFVENIMDARGDVSAVKNDVEYFNSILRTNPTNIEQLRQMNGVLSWINKSQEAAVNNDELEYRDALAGQHIQTEFMLSNMKNTIQYAAFIKRLEALSKLDTKNNESLKAIIDYQRNLNNDTTSTDEEIISRVSENAKVELERMRKIDAWSDMIESEFGNSIGSDVKEGLVYNQIMLSEWNDRINSINKSLSEKLGISISSDSSSEVNDAFAKYGSLANAMNTEKLLRDKLDDLKKKTPRRERGIQYDALVRQIKDEIKKIKKDVKILEKNENKVLTASEIMNLSPDARATIMNEKNSANYSNEQIDVVEGIKKNENYTDQVKTDIADAGRIKERLEYNKTNLYNLRRNKGMLPNYIQEIKSNIVKKNLENRFSDVIDADYDKFRKAIDDFIEDKNVSDFEKSLLNDVVKDSKNYKQYIEELEARKTNAAILQNSPKFMALSEKERNIISLAYRDAIKKGKVTSDTLLDTIKSDEFKDFAKRNNIDMNELKDEEIKKITQSVSEIFKEIDVYNSNQKFIVEEFKKKIEDEAKSKQFDTQETENHIFNYVKYINNKDLYDTLFNRVADYFTKKKGLELLREDYITLMSLFSDNDIFIGDIISDIDITFNKHEIEENIKRLTDYLKNLEYSNDIKNSRVYQSNQNLLNAFREMLNLSSSYKITVTKLVERSIKDVNSDFDKVFKEKPISIKLPKPDKVGTLNAKPYTMLNSDSERKWYEKNNIRENLKKIADIFTGIKSKDAEVVLINDNALADAYQTEVGQLNTDNYPLVMAVRVEDGTEDAVVIDGKSYLYAGFLQESRVGVENENTLNSIRGNVISRDRPEGVVRNSNGSIYTSKGIRIVRQKTRVKAGSAMDMYIGENGKFAKEYAEAKTEDEKKAIRDRIVADFKNHIVDMKSTVDKSKIVKDKDGNDAYKAVLSYTYKDASGKPISRTYPYTVSLNRASDTSHMVAYVDEKNPEHPVIYYVNTINDVYFDESGSNIFDVLTETDLSDKQYASTDVNFIRKAINTVYEQLERNVENKNISDADLSNAINTVLNRHINLLQSYAQRSSKRFGDVRIVADRNMKSRTVRLYAVTPEGDIIKGMDNLATISFDAFKNGGDGKMQVQLAIRNIIYNGDGSVRTDNYGNSIAKIQVQYSKLLQDRNDFDENYLRYVLFSNMLVNSGWEITGEVEELSTNETVQERQSSGDKVKDAMDALTTHLKGESYDKSQERDGSVGVTTFIRNYEEDTSITNDKARPEVAYSLGTSIDKLIRAYLNGSERTKQNIIDFMKSGPTELFTYPGFGDIKNNANFDMFIKGVEDVAKMLEDNGETIVKGEYRFNQRLIHGGLYADVTAEPDLITVDKNGNYHIYDFKTFYNTPGAIATVEGKSTPQLRIFGLNNVYKNVSKWTDQLSLYKDAIEKSTGGRVVELGVIPIRLSYNKDESFIGEKKYPVIDTPMVFSGRNAENGMGIALKFNFNNNGILDNTPATRVIEDVISIKPKNVTDISSDKWKVYSKSEKTADELNAKKQPQKKIEGVISETSQTVDASTMSTRELIDLMNDGSSEITGLSESESVGFTDDEMKKLMECDDYVKL